MKYFILTLSFFFLTTQLIGQEKEWVIIAKKDVSYKAEKDMVQLFGNERDVKKIKLRCEQGSLKIKKIILIYKNSKNEEHKPKGTGILTKGTSSFPIKISEEEKLSKVEIHYEAYGNMLLTKRAKVEILGLK